MVQIFNSIFPKVCKNGIRTFVPGALEIHVLEFFPARRYASAGTSYDPVSLCVCLSVCLSVTSPCSVETDKRIGWFLARELPSTCPTVCFKEIQVPSKIRVLPSVTLLQTLDLENFATAYRSSKRVIDFARERWTLRA